MIIGGSSFTTVKEKEIKPMQYYEDFDRFTTEEVHLSQLCGPGWQDFMQTLAECRSKPFLQKYKIWPLSHHPPAWALGELIHKAFIANTEPK